MKKRYKNIQKDTIKNLPISIIGTNYNVKKCKLYNEKVSEFDNINDLIDFCLCSSYIPYISGSTFSKKYKGSFYIDGEVKSTIHAESDKKNTIDINRFMWGRQFTRKELLYLDKDKSRELFTNGWEDTKNNKDKILDILKKYKSIS